jgi:predicted PurR-regulated permease PerM
MEIQTNIPIWVLVTLVGVFFSGFVGLLIWIVNYIITQKSETDKKQDNNFERLTQAVTAIKETTIIQTEILKRHENDLEGHSEKIDKILEYIGKTIKK